MPLSKEQEFWKAVDEGNLSLVKKLAADSKLNVNWQGEIGYTPFNTACYEGHVSIVEFLLTLPKVDVNEPIIGGSTPFFMACYKGHKEIVSLLLADPRIDVNKAMNKEATPFYIACQKGHKEVVSLLLADLRIDINKSDHNHATPLWFASQNGHLPVVQLILASGREVDIKTKCIAGTYPWNNKTAIEMARWSATAAAFSFETEEDLPRRKQFCPLIAALIDSYEQNPQQVRSHLRNQLSLKGKTSLRLFFDQTDSKAKDKRKKGTKLKLP